MTCREARSNSCASKTLDPRQLSDTAREVQQSCVAQAAECYQQVQSEFNEAVIRLILEVAKQLADGFVSTDIAPMPPSADGPACRVADSLNVMFSTFEDLRNTLYGGMAGAMLTNVGFGLLAIVIPPAAAVAGLAAVVGSCVGAWQAGELAKAKKGRGSFQIAYGSADAAAHGAAACYQSVQRVQHAL